ncbi:unnamed protein product [Dimorphilus gyrociliatus]|uniref:Uncharacterized protein n=1 Tax=Dimorphilus gyrociliatus TaxID=2664684 RepID=A0A7I8WDR0_9ANNE|nr:unnamed protein product [Dimorphilus gyrociliatus]
MRCNAFLVADIAVCRPSTTAESKSMCAEGKFDSRQYGGFDGCDFLLGGKFRFHHQSDYRIILQELQPEFH